jgi:lipoyl(octanoyl) transferase
MVGAMSHDMSRELWVVSAGRVPYGEALVLQREIAAARIDGSIPHDVLLLVEHPPVVTLGRSAKSHHMLCTPAVLAARGIDFHEVERGGDVTFHGPGQLVGYPIIDLKRHKQDLHWYLRQVEEALITGLDDLGIVADRHAGLTGVWTQGRKIASIGVHARDWVTWHGFALNVTTDLAYFDLIVPCGIDGVVMTSVARELGVVPDAGQVERTIAAAFGEIFRLNPVTASLDSRAGGEGIGQGGLPRRRRTDAGPGQLEPASPD